MTPIKMDSLLVLPIVNPKEVSHMFWCETSFLFLHENATLYFCI